MTVSDWINSAIFAITAVGVFIGWYSNNKQIKNSNEQTALQIKEAKEQMLAQIENSNKQSLFEKRLEVFVIAEGFKQLLEENKDVLEIPTGFYVMNPIHFHYMINNTYLNELAEVMPEPMDVNAPSPLSNPDAQRKFLIKREEIFQKVKTAELIFEEPENEIISKFMSDYITLLDNRRRYEIMFKSYHEAEKRARLNPKMRDMTTEEYFDEHTDESKYRQELLIEPINSLTGSYKEYKEQQAKIKEQISLKRGRK